MVQTTTIHTDDGQVELSSFTEGDRMTWLEFNELKDKKYPDFSLVWDNEDYLFNEFYSFLHRWKERTCKYEDQLEFKDVWHYLEDNEGLVDDLIEMLDEALKQGWYESNGTKTE